MDKIFLLMKLQIAREGQTHGENIEIINKIANQTDLNTYLLCNRGLTLNEWFESLTWENGLCLNG